MTDCEKQACNETVDGFESIYREHYSRLYTLAFRMTGTPENAEDVLQTSFLEAFKGFSGFRFESSPYTWLYRIVLNTAKKHFLKWEKMPMEAYAETNGTSVEEAYAVVNTFGEIEDQVLTARVQETCLQMFMNCMPAKYRTVYTLRSMLQFSSKDTAEILEISEDAVKTNLHRARKIARDHLDGKCSLIKPGSMCNCRSIAAFMKRNNRLHRLQNIEMVRRKEQEAVSHFTQEMGTLLAVDGLYATELSNMDYDAFKLKLKTLKKEGSVTLLNY